MNIEKLCKKFHEKVGKDKTVRISVEENAESLPLGEYLQAEFNLTGDLENQKPYMKIRQIDKILHLYLGKYDKNILKFPKIITTSVKKDSI